MPDFRFLKNPLAFNWIILAPRRAKRPDEAKGLEPQCPFCPGREGAEEEIYRIPVISSLPADATHQALQAGQSSVVGSKSAGLSVDQTDEQRTEQPASENRPPKTDNWLVRVIPNKYPFTPHHELVIHSPDHHKSFGELPTSHVELILQTYRQRYNALKEFGQVYIFHNHGPAGGESLPHPHSQIAVVPQEVKMNIPQLDPAASANIAPSAISLNERESSVISSLPADATHQALQAGQSSVVGSESAGLSVGQTDKQKTEELSSENRKPITDNSKLSEQSAQTVQTAHFYLFAPATSQWPDEVWVTPKKRGRLFGEITDEEITDLAFVLDRLIDILDLRHGHEFPYNFYIYPGGDWYLRLIPRTKSLGGFEIGTGIFVNTQEPAETIEFLKTHFENPNREEIEKKHQADYDLQV